MADPVARRRELRLSIRERRASLSDDEQAAASMAVMARLARIAVLRDASLVAGYRAVRGELDVDAPLTLLIERGATVTVPRVVGDQLDFAMWTPDASSADGPFGVPEPTMASTVPLTGHDVVLVPLVAFDGAGHRLGHGGGYYDRALARRQDLRPVIIGIAHAFQEVDAVPTEPWDVALDAVVTDDGVREFTPGSLDPPI